MPVFPTGKGLFGTLAVKIEDHVNTFGETFRHIYGQQKLKELRSFHREVTTLEVDWYLRQV